MRCSTARPSLASRFLPLALAVVLWATGASQLAAAAPTPDPTVAGLSATERLEALIDRVKHEQEQLRTLEARFVQRQESEFLVDEEESRGTFSFAAPDRVRWEYEAPNPVTLLIDGKTMTTWYRDLDRVEEVKVGRYSDRILKYLGAGGSLAELVEYFEVRAAFSAQPDAPYRLELTPRYARIAKRLESMTLWIDPQRYLPARLRFVSGAGDVTEFIFDRFEVNEALPSDRFELDLPDGVEVHVIDLERGS